MTIVNNKLSVHPKVQSPFIILCTVDAQTVKSSLCVLVVYTFTSILGCFFLNFRSYLNVSIENQYKFN